VNAKNLTHWTCGLIGGATLLGVTAQAAWPGRAIDDPLRQHLADGQTVGAGGTVELYANEGYISTPEGGSVYTWGYSTVNGDIQYPGPTLIMTAGQAPVTVILHNNLPFPCSITFPGMEALTTSGGSAGLLTQEAPALGDVTYKFVASKPGTFIYQSGTRGDLQVEMGLSGAIIVRPASFNNLQPATWRAFDTADTAFDQEYLFVLSDMDPGIHEETEAAMLMYEATGGILINGEFNQPVDTVHRVANYWFINGRCGPDTMVMPATPSLPYQPYDAFPWMHPGQKLLMRTVGAGRDPHPFHHHGNHALVIGRNGRMLTSNGSAADLGYLVFTTPSYPGETTDGIFTYEGKDLGWDIYGHTANESPAPHEYGPDHGKPFPVVLPTEQDQEYGLFYSGSPFMGGGGFLPPGFGGFNPNNGFTFMWHSHAEREIVNNNAFPGGMLTMLVVDPWPMP